MLFDKLEIISIRGHYEAYLDNEFICSGDTYNECYQDAIDIIINGNDTYK